MKITDFKIGEVFYGSAGFAWKCTDIGTRTIVAIMLDSDKSKDWFVGPPYAVNEEVFDEYDMKSCYLKEDDMLEERFDSLETSYHPGFEHSVFSKMNHWRASRLESQYKSILKLERVDEKGNVWHAFGVEKRDKKVYIKILEIFDEIFDEMEENEFIKLKICTKNDLKNKYEIKHPK